jgi:hypothetical protein
MREAFVHVADRRAMRNVLRGKDGLFLQFKTTQDSRKRRDHFQEPLMRDELLFNGVIREA